MDIVKKEAIRDSNMELLRIVTMFLIVILHLDIFLLEEPQYYSNQPFVQYYIYFIKSLAIIGVNVFIMLSGWYGITFKWKRFCFLWLQVIYFTFIGILFNFITNGDWIDLKSILYFLFQMDQRAYGFFQSYIILYIFSPILNLFTQNNNKNSVPVFLCFFFTIQFLWGCLSWGYIYFGNGYSALSFMGIYILARYAHIKKVHKKFTHYHWGGLYFLSSIILSTIAFTSVNHTYIHNLAYSYASPLVIISSFALLAFFSRLEFYNKMTNKIAKHCFAIYLFHMNYYVLPKIISYCKDFGMQDDFSTFNKYFLLTCTLIFVISLFLDILFLFLYNTINHITTRYENHM